MLDRGSGGRGGGMEEAGHVELIIVFVNTMYIHINIFLIIYNDDIKVVGHFELGMVTNKPG